MYAVVVGILANLLVVIVSLVMIPRLVYAYRQNILRQYLHNQWLGYFNGAFVVVFWSITSFIINAMSW